MKDELKRMKALMFGYKKPLSISDSYWLIQKVEEQQKEIEELKERLRLSDFRSNY